jgi:hypothetical protein
MSNSEPSAIVLHGSLHRRIIHKLRFEWRNRFAQGLPRFILSRSAHEVSNWLAQLVENQACGIAKYPDNVFVGTPKYTARGADDSCKTA